jgi:hypothetical protein
LQGSELVQLSSVCRKDQRDEILAMIGSAGRKKLVIAASLQKAEEELEQLVSR